jgi:hypothetical protein
MKETIFESLMALMLQVQGEVARNTPRATGGLSGSWLTDGQMAVSGVEVRMGSPLWDSYGSYPEFGTKPHWAPIEPLVTWVREKGLDKASIDVHPVKGKIKRVRGQSGADYREKKIRRIARAIQIKIAKDGTRAQEYVVTSLRSLGLTYELVKADDGIFYVINPESYLESVGLADKLKGKLP